jgi:hypothetical protein
MSSEVAANTTVANAAAVKDREFRIEINTAITPFYIEEQKGISNSHGDFCIVHRGFLEDPAK